MTPSTHAYVTPGLLLMMLTISGCATTRCEAIDEDRARELALAHANVDPGNWRINVTHPEASYWVVGFVNTDDRVDDAFAVFLDDCGTVTQLRGSP
ncbi:hypothetical protein [Lysobacter sp. A3-1-A15]|uniref:hypothetical protein n=1 Tax=Novilysobacter viscosus TaxID=3098602 RepID=UPI002EDA091C